MTTREATTSCRICAGQCGLKFTIDATGHIVSAAGDKDNPVTRGYACIKGLYAHQALYSPDRILHPLKRQADGSFARIALDTALDEIAAQMRQLIAQHGADAIAGFRGTMNYCNATANRMLPDWLRALGSASFFSTMTVDQSAKWISFERLGGWAAGRDSFEVAQVLMCVGSNPLVSLSTFNFALQHPVKQLREFKQRGGKLIVIDPRHTETARHADIFLQPYPGEDPTLTAALLRHILVNQWHDLDFCARYVAGFDALRTTVEPFTLDYAAARCGVAAADIAAAAKLFAYECKRGSAASGTGPNMAAHSNLAEHLIECLNVVCGRYARAGDRVTNPGVVGPRQPRVAQVIAPRRSWQHTPKSRVREFGTIFGEKMSGSLAEEITTPGPGQLRALFVDGGNPATCIPDEQRIAAALRELELLVCIEPFMTNTARLAHYIIPPKLMFERFDLASRDYETIINTLPYTQYAEPVVTPPNDSEVVDDWYVFWALAQRLGVALNFDGVPLCMDHAPSTEELLAILARHSSVPFADIRAATAGRVFAVEPMTVLPGDPQSAARFDVMPDDVRSELAAVLTEESISAEFPLRLSARRMREVQNTMYHQLPAIRRQAPFNPLWVHPSDLAALGLHSGDSVELCSEHGCIVAKVEADASMRCGVVSMAHGWGDLPGDHAGFDKVGTNTNLLIDTVHVESINAMPRMSGIPVRLQPVARDRSL